MKLDRVILNRDFTTKEEVLQFISTQMAELGVVGQTSEFLEALNRRESEGTTGLVDGFAIPHGKDGRIRSAAVIYLRNASGIAWDTLDGSLVTDIFALAIPQNGSEEHLENLIAISTSLMDEDVCLNLRAAGDEDGILKVFA